MNETSTFGELSRVAILLFSFAFLGCGERLSEDECLRLLDRYTDKVIDQARPGAGQAERAEMIQEARRKAKIDPAFAECSARVSRTDFQCAMDAKDADQIERCLL
jgi:hypothetical protein